MSALQQLRNILSAGRNSQNCHGEGMAATPEGLRRIGLVGTPNVGKSAIFNALTGAYASVSNYPGTTVSISSGKTRIGQEDFEVMDTPGMYSIMPITDEERVARTMLMTRKPDAVLHVVNAGSLERMLPLTIQLMEAGLPVILVLNMMDETETAGIEINIDRLEDRLGIPVVGTVATSGRGIANLKKRVGEYVAIRHSAQI